MSKFFQLSEEDLETLEQAMPEICEALEPESENRRDIQDHISMVKSIISNVRWNYRPHIKTNREEI